MIRSGRWGAPRLERFLDGELCLYFELGLSSPEAYWRWLTAELFRTLRSSRLYGHLYDQYLAAPRA